MKENKDDIYPLCFKTLELEQNKDKDLMAEIQKENHPYTLNTFCGVEETSLYYVKMTELLFQKVFNNV